MISDRRSFPSRDPACRILKFPPVNFVGVSIDHGFKNTANDGFVIGTNQSGYDKMPLSLHGLSGCPLGINNLLGLSRFICISARLKYVSPAAVTSVCKRFS